MQAKILLDTRIVSGMMSRMTNYEKAGPEIKKMAGELIAKFDTHKPIIENEVRIDYVMAFSEKDENGQPIGCALKSGGYATLASTRKVNLKDRSKGMGDAEIVLDGDWWENASETDQMALLDHELHHIAPTGKIDTLRRPIIKLRKHDYHFGWFRVIAERHGSASQERKQASQIVQESGQLLFPELMGISQDKENVARMVRTRV